MKRNIFRIIALLLFVAVSTTTCKEEILDVENKNTLTAENWYKTKKDFELAVNSCYSPLMDRSMFGNEFFLNMESWSDRVLFETTGRDRLSFNSSTGQINSLWKALYFGLYRTSKLIKKMTEKGVDGIENMEESTYNYYLAQAKSLRGVYYFYLVVFFHKPIFYNEDNIPTDYLKNLSNGEPKQFWDQLEKDFTEAIPHLKFKSELPASEMGRVTKGGARSMLAKALLYKHYHYYVQNGNKGSAGDQEDLNQAKQLLETVINSNEYSLVQPKEPKTRQDYLYALLSNSSFVDLETESGNTYKSENNQESVWEIQYTTGPAFNNNYWLPGWMAPGEMSYQYYSPHQESYKNHEPHPALFRAFETEGAPDGFDRDPRCDATLYFTDDQMDFREDSPYNKGFSALTNIKRIARTRSLDLPSEHPFGFGFQKHFFPVFYQGNAAPINSPSNKRMIRYADVLLFYAEVEYLLGNTTGPGLDALNQVRERVDMPTIDQLTPEAIKHERDVEMAYEFSRWFDLVRWSFDPEWGVNWDEIQWGIDSENSVNPFVKGKNEYLPIPLAEIDLHEGELEQNPGW
jgi:hypothetical protein